MGFDTGIRQLVETSASASASTSSSTATIGAAARRLQCLPENSLESIAVAIHQHCAVFDVDLGTAVDNIVCTALPRFFPHSWLGLEPMAEATVRALAQRFKLIQQAQDAVCADATTCGHKRGTLSFQAVDKVPSGGVKPREGECGQVSLQLRCITADGNSLDHK